MGDPLTPPLLLLTKMLSLDTLAMIAMERKLLQAASTPFSCHLSENSILGHLSPFVPAQGQPLDPTSAFIDRNVITRCCCSDSYRKKTTPGYYHPIFPSFAWKFNIWPFCPICACSWATPWPHLCFYWQRGYHLVLLQLYLWKESLSKPSQFHFVPLPHAIMRP